MAVSKDLTELVEIDPERVDGVKTPASGFKFLIIKSAAKDVNAQGGVNEKPDIAGAENVLQMLARLIESEARELAVGNWGEVCDIELLVQAAHLLNCFRCMEEMGDEDDGDPVMKSLTEDELTQVSTWVAKRKVSASERKRLAGEGHALPDGSYPIETTEDLHNAAILARSGHGDVAAAGRLIAKRAKELGVANPLAKEAQLSNETVPTESTETPSAPVEKSTAELIAEAIAKSDAAHEEAMKGLRDELTELKNRPLPGGPKITAAKATAAASSTAEADRYERLSKEVSDRELARYYADRAREAREASAK